VQWVFNYFTRNRSALLITNGLHVAVEIKEDSIEAPSVEKPPPS
jgi:hypothetical protein